jgi:hypothetical protein
MNLKLTALAFTLIIVSNIASGQDDNHSMFPAGSEALGRCVLDQLLGAAKQENERLKAIIDGTEVSGYPGAYPRDKGEFRLVMREYIQNCPEQRYKAAFESAKVALGGDDIEGNDLLFFGAVAEDAVVSILLKGVQED